MLAEIEKQRLPSGDGQVRAHLENALERSRSVGAWVHTRSLGSGDTNVKIRAGTLGAKRRLCKGQRFAAQPRAALGTAFLVGPDTVVTAAHVVPLRRIKHLRLVFDFVVAKVGEHPSTCAQVYTPGRAKLLDRGDGKYDWAVVKLDRDVVGVPPLEFAKSSYRLPRGSPVYMWGHSAGTPKKYVPGRVVENDGDESLQMELDAFGGDSGAPVFNQEHEVVGLLYGGSMDWVRKGGCYEVARAWVDEGGELVTRLELLPRNVRR